MSDIDTLIQDYIAVWNEPDVGRRRHLIRTLSQKRPIISCARSRLSACRVISVGLDFLVLGADGRIRIGYQFIEA